MLADKIVEAATGGVAVWNRVHLVTDMLKEAQISEIEHMGDGLLRCRHHHFLNDHVVPETSVRMLSVMPPEDQ